MDVMARVRAVVVYLYANRWIGQVEVPALAEAPDDLWLRFAGMWQEDPDWDLFQAEIQAFRDEIDRETIPA